MTIFSITFLNYIAKKKNLNSYRGLEFYYTNPSDRNTYHRVLGPARITQGVLVWYFKNKQHRLGGPAIYNLENGSKAYYINGRYKNGTSIYP